MAIRVGSTTAGAPVMLSWGAIFGGAFAALGVWVLLYTFGLALGLSTIDRSEDLVSILTPGLGTGLWSLITPIVALFVGGLVASRTAGIVDRMVGTVHGVVLWGITTVLAVVLVGWGLSAVLNTAFRVGSTAVSLTGQAVAGAARGGQDVAQMVGINAQDLLGPVNERLQARGQPPITAEQLQAAVQDSINTALREGQLDRETLVGALARNTALTTEDVQETATVIEQRFNQARQQIGQGVERAAVGAANVAGKVFWFVFFSQLLSLVAAVLGASIGVTRRQRLAAARVAPTVPETPAPAGSRV